MSKDEDELLHLLKNAAGHHMDERDGMECMYRRLCGEARRRIEEVERMFRCAVAAEGRIEISRALLVGPVPAIVRYDAPDRKAIIFEAP